METETNINLIQRFWQASERGYIDEMAAFWAPDAIQPRRSDNTGATPAAIWTSGLEACIQQSPYNLS